MSISVSDAATNAQLDTLASLLDGGYLRLFTGQRPSSPDAAISSQTLLAELKFGRPAFNAASDGMLRARAIKPDDSVAQSGTVGWYRAYMRDGKTAIIDGTVGTKDADMIVNFTDVQKTAIFSIQDFRIRVRRPG